MNNSSKKLAVAVLFGGASSEYEVSLSSAFSVLSNIDETKYDIYKIGITKAGDMFYYTGDISRIKDDLWQGEDCTRCTFSSDRSQHGIIVLQSEPKAIYIDTVFPVLHGKNGEDGTIQGLLSFAGIPFVGCDLISSANCMDKVVTKTMFDHVGIKNAKWIWFSKHDYSLDADQYHTAVENEIGFPCFVKPANAGSSVGITKAHDKAELLEAIKLAFSHDKKVLIEKMVHGIELECAVLGNDEPIASMLGEIEPCNEFYDYDAKYIANKTVTYMPARISDNATEEIRSVAVQAYRLLGCSGLSRVDFFLCDGDSYVLNEINTIPGFTPISMYPKLFAEGGLPYPKLIDRLIELSLERN